MPTRGALHEALLRANPERLMWGTDWPHPSIAAAVMPDDGHLLDLLFDWTPDEAVRRQDFGGDAGEVIRQVGGNYSAACCSPTSMKPPDCRRHRSA